MPIEECQMTKPEGGLKSENRMADRPASALRWSAYGFQFLSFGIPSDLGIRISDFFRHSPFVIRHFHCS
jgi:hypothetical protein